MSSTAFNTLREWIVAQSSSAEFGGISQLRSALGGGDDAAVGAGVEQLQPLLTELDNDEMLEMMKICDTTEGRFFAGRERGCKFCDIQDGYPEDRLIGENRMSYAIIDRFPATPFHSLIIPKRHVVDVFDLIEPELIEMTALLTKSREFVLNEDPSIEGFNIGTNNGVVAGQSIFHVHIHLIPRRRGDVEDPRGGVRGVIPKKRPY
jgi:diadenosine tetraphosphate (Ap4A) HIT family hydrolase